MNFKQQIDEAAKDYASDNGTLGKIDHDMYEAFLEGADFILRVLKEKESE